MKHVTEARTAIFARAGNGWSLRVAALMSVCGLLHREASTGSRL
jgi:hypothetical protein